MALLNNQMLYDNMGLGKLSYFTSLNSSAMNGDDSRYLNHDSSEVAVRSL